MLKEKIGIMYTPWGTTFRVHVRVFYIYLKKEMSPDLTKKVEKNNIRMVITVRVHPVGCQEGGHMTNCQMGCSPEL